MDVQAREAAVRAALERMETASKALDEAKEDADLEALQRTYDEAKAEHTSATVALERAKAVAEARENAPVEPVEDEVDPEAETQERSRTPEARVRREPATYERFGPHNLFHDMVEAKVNDNVEARDRLERHRREMAEQRVNPNQAAGQGGEFIPPVWMAEEWVKLPRASRAVADSLNRKPRPPKTNSINLPKVATGAATAVQTDAGAVQSTDSTTTSVAGAVQTIAGQQDVSQQLVDLSQPGYDAVILDDLGRDYNQKLDVAVINGSVTNAKGLLQLASTNSVTFTQATPTVPLLYPKVADGVQQIHTGIFRPPTVIAMHPRRWAWILAALDSQNRPLVTPYASANAIARMDGVAPEAVVGELQGVPVITDANIPITNGAGTNEDAILVYSATDLYLFEDEVPTFRVLTEVLSGTLQVRIQVYGYYALIAGRLPKAISKITGTGLATPTF